MKKFAKGALALLLAIALCFSLAGCYDENMTWAAKKGDTELPIGAYIYYLSVAYNEAASQIGTDTEVLKGEVEGQPADEWIRERAKAYVNQYFWMDDEIARLGLEMTDEDYTSAQQSTSSYWTYFGSVFEDYGIAQSSFDIAYSQYNQKYLMVFKALYGEGGEREVPQADIQDYYEQNYYSYEYFTAPLTTVSEDGSSVEMTDEEKAEVAGKLEKVKTDILSGKKTVTDAANDYALEIGEDSSYQTGIKDQAGMESAYLPSEFIDTLTAMSEDGVEIFEASGYMVLLHRLPIKDSEEEILADDDSRMNLIIEIKSEEFKDYVSEAAQGVEGVELNDKAISRYKPSMFTDSTKNGTSSVPEESSESEADDSSESSAD
ncbi:MAG: hypothetical protein ACI4GO_03555 [Hominenteromicrobium sp.]